MRTNVLNDLSNVVKKGTGLACSWSQVGRMSEGGAIEHPLSTHSAPFGIRRKPAGEKGSARVWKHVAMIFAVLVMSMANIGMAWGDTASAASAGTYSFGSTSIGGGNKFGEIAANSVFVYRWADNYSTSNNGIKAQSGNTSGFVFYINSPMTLSAGVYQNSSTAETVTIYVKSVTSAFFQNLVDGTANSTTVPAPVLTDVGTFSVVGSTSKKEYSGTYGSSLSAGYYYVYARTTAGTCNTYHRSITLAAGTKRIYMKAGAWNSDSPKFYVHSWGSSNNDVQLTAVGGCEEADLYKADIPSGNNNLLFTRQNPSSTEINWDYNDKLWNQSENKENIGSNDLFTFTGWGSGGEHPLSTFSSGTFSATTFTISFAGNGGSGSISDISSIACEADQTVTPNSFTKVGYRFTGWKADVDVKVSGSTKTAGTVLADGVTIQDITSNITLTAQWEEIDCPDEGTLFSMTVTSSSSVRPPRASDASTPGWLDLSEYATISGYGRAKAGNKATGSDKGGISSTAVNLDGNDAIFWVELDCPLQAGDVITATVSGNTVYLTPDQTRAEGISLSTGSNITYTIVAKDKLEGETNIYGWKGGGNAKISAFSITRSSACSATQPGAISKGSLSSCSLPLTASGSPVSNNTWYWQSAANGTDKTGTSGATKNVTSPGTYYIRSYYSTGDCWSDAQSVTVSASDLTPAAPTALAAASPTAKGVTLTVTDAANTNDYEFYVNTSSSAPSASTPASYTSTSKSVTITDKYAGTTFYAWARAKCGSNKSAWTALTGSTFTTSTVSVEHALTNITETSGAATSGVGGSDYTAVYAADPGYSLSAPAITIGGAAASSGTDYTWSSGTLTIPANKINGNIVITLNSAATAPSSVSIGGTYHYYPGETISLTATATGGNGPKTYQWYKGGTAEGNKIAGATSATYEKATCVVGDAGSYYCKVTCGGSASKTSSAYQVKIMQFYLKNSSGVDIDNYALQKVDATHATLALSLTGGTTYNFRVTDGCNNWYGNSDETGITSSNCSNWTMPHDADCKVTTSSKSATYTFNFDFSGGLLGSEMKVSVVYPAGDQAAGKVIYWDNSVLNWDAGKQWYRIGKGTHNNKTQMTLVPGTANLYKITTAEYNGFEYWHIANNEGEGTSNIFWTKDSDPTTNEEITNAMGFEGSPVTAAAVTFTPTLSHATGSSSDNNNCEFYEYGQQNGMKRDRVTITAPVNGTVTVNYTSEEDVASSFSATTVDMYQDLAHTVKLTSITAVANTGYDAGAITINGGAYSANYVVMGATTIAVSFTPHVYSITYKDQGNVAFSGSHVDSPNAHPTSHTYATATTLNSATKTGYTFGGWYTESDCSSGLVTSLGATAFTADITLYAKWTVNNYDLTWNLGGGTTTSAGTGIASGVSVNTTSSVAYSTALTAPTVTKANYTFSAWSPAVAATMPAEDVEYTATFTANQYSVTHSLTNMSTTSGSTGANAATYGTNYSAVLAADDGYTLPATITVTAGATDITANCTWNSSTGAVSIPGSYITGNITITASGVVAETPCFEMAANSSAGSDATLANNESISQGSKNCTTLIGGTAVYSNADGDSKTMKVAKPSGGAQYGWYFNVAKDVITITLTSSIIQVGSVITFSGYVGSANYGISVNTSTTLTKSGSSGEFTKSYTVTAGDTHLIGKNVLVLKREGGSAKMYSFSVSNCQSATPCTTPTLPSLSNQAGCSYSAWNATPTNASTITSAGESISYSWKKGATEKATTASYTPDADGTDYTVTVTVSKAGSISTSVTSSALTATKYAATAIGTQPATAVSADEGENFTLGTGMVATGHGDLSYQWYSYTTSGGAGEASIGSATSATYTTSKAEAGTYYYKVKVTADCGTVASNMIAVTVTEAPCFKFAGGTKDSGWPVAIDGSITTSLYKTSTGAVLTGGTVVNSGTATIGSNDGVKGLVFDAAGNNAITITLSGTHAFAVGTVITISGASGDDNSSSNNFGFSVNGNNLETTSISTAKASFEKSYTVAASDGVEGGKTIQIKLNTSCLRKTYLKSVTVTGCAEVTGYTIAFAGNGNTGGSMSDVTEIEEGDDVTLAANGFTKNGYTFANWTADVAVTVNSATVAVGDPIADEATIQNVTSDITLTAQWTPNNYTITYNLNGASWAGAYSAPATYTVGTGATLPISSNMTNTGYTFGGWYDNSGLTGSSVTAISTSEYGDKEFWAKWTENTYTITYKKNGDGAGNDGDVTGSTSSTNGHYVTVADNGFALENHVFAGWNTAANGSGESYSEGEEIELTDDMTLYAIWADDYSVTWGDVQIGGAGDAVTPNLGGKNYTITATIATWTGDVTDIELGDVTEGVIAAITGTTSSPSKTVTITFAVGTSVVGSSINLSLNVPAHGDYGVKTSTKAITIDRCTGGKDEIRFISSNKNDAGDNFADMSTTKNTTQYVGSDIAKLIATGSAGLNLANNKIGYRFDRLNVVFKLTTTTTLDVYYNANATNKTFALYSFSSDKELSAIGTSDYSTKSIVSSGITVTNVSFSEGSKSTPAGTNSVSSGVVKLVTAGGIKASYASLAAGYYVLISGSGEEGYLYGLDITGGSGSGKITPTLTWSPLVSSDAAWDGVNNRLNKRTSDADFTFTATQDKNSLGAITYASSNTSVVTVNATTGKVHVEGAGDATITATLAESGCYNKATATYAIHVVDDCDDEAGTISTEDLGCDGIRMTVTGHTAEAGVTYQWYKNGEEIGGATSATYTATEPGEYYVEVTNDGEGHCTKASTNTVTLEASESATASKIVNQWYVKNGRRTPDVALVQTTNATGFYVKIGDDKIWDEANDVTTGFGGCPFRLGDDGIIYLNGQTSAGAAPSGLTTGDVTLKITATACGGNSSELSIVIHKQAATTAKSVAFVVDGTKGGEITAFTAAHATTSPLYVYLDSVGTAASARQFSLTGRNAYWSTVDSTLKAHYSQFDVILITDDPSTQTVPDGVSGKDAYKTQGYINALGALIDVRPILTMEAFVSALANWKSKGINGNPTSPNPRQYAMKLDCKDHEIFNGLEEGANVVATVEDGTTYWTVTMVDKTKSPYSALATDATDYDGTPALQGFSASDVSSLLLLGEISDGAYYAGVERQEEPAARLMLLGLNAKALPNALTEEGKIIIENALTYLLKTNMEEVDDCSNYFTGATSTDWSTATNWSKGVVPNSPMVRARILKPCEISGVTAKAAQVDIVTGGTSSKFKGGSGTCTGKLTINPTGALVVGGEIRTAEAPYYNKADLMPTDTNNLVINTNATNQAALVFNNDKGDTKATVNLHSLGRYKDDAYQFQYFAVPMTYLDVNPAFAGQGIYTYVWTEASGWERRGYYTGLEAFEGVGITTRSGTASNYQMKGMLAATTEKEITLTAETNGQNIVGNSWTAPIDIASLRSALNGDANIVQKTVYIYCTGNDGLSVGYDDEETPGQWLAIPIDASGWEGWNGLKVIPAMQAFCIKANSETTLTLNYDSLVRKRAATMNRDTLTTPLRAPKREAEAIELIRIRVADSQTHTDLYLFEGESFSEEFDNGWEAKYMSGDGRSAKLYAETAIGPMAVVAQPEYEGTVLGFAPGKETEYTFTFSGPNKEYYLNDLKEKKSTLISEDESYMFTFEEGDTNRFYISKTPINAPSVATGTENTGDGTKARKVLVNDKLYIILNGRVYSAEGVMVK